MLQVASWSLILFDIKTTSHCSLIINLSEGKNYWWRNWEITWNERLGLAESLHSVVWFIRLQIDREETWQKLEWLLIIRAEEGEIKDGKESWNKYFSNCWMSNHYMKCMNLFIETLTPNTCQNWKQSFWFLNILNFEITVLVLSILLDRQTSCWTRSSTKC